MSQTVQTKFGTGTVVDRENVRGRVSYKVEGPGFSTWIEATAMPLDFQWMPGPDDIQPNSVTLPYNPAPQSWVNPAEQNIQPGQRIDPRKRTAPADSVDFQEDGESYEPGPDPRLFATGGLDPEDVQAKLGPKYVNAFVEHDFTSLQARLEEHPEIVFSEVRERVGELVAQADQENLERVGRNERLEASDPQLREAAWKDVRAKAVRLRKSGQINTRGATPEVIAAQVTGDHGTYEVMVMRSNIFQGNSAVDSWTCECPWGQWAWKREHAFVGRMCSHAYASLMELQSLTQSKNPNPKFRNQPTVWASRTAEAVNIGSKIFHRDYADIYGTVVEDDGDAYLVDGDGGEYWIDHEDARLASRTAEIVDLRPVGWDPYSRSLMNKLRALTDEGSRPGRQKERNEEIRELVTELRERGFDTNGIIASHEAFMDRPYGYDDIPDYGTTLDYILDHEVQKREDVEEPEFEYPAGGSHGVVNDINDGGGERTSAYEDDYAYGEPPAYGSGDEYGGDENPYYVDPAEQTDWEDPLPDSTTEDDVIANFQRNAGWLMGNDGGGSGGNDDIAAAAEAHLRTAGRHFTMAEQQALIDEDDGKPYDRSQLRLRGTHYEVGDL